MRFTIAEIAAAIGAESWGETGAAVTGAAEPAQAGPHDLALAMTPRFLQALQPGAMAIIAEGADPAALGLRAAIIVARPRLAMAALTRAFDPGSRIAPGIHPSAIIEPGAKIGEGAAIGPLVTVGAGARIGPRARIGAGAVIGADAIIGADALIGPRVVIGHGVIAGARLIVQPGAVIGGDGFSFVTEAPSGVEEIRESLGQRDTPSDAPPGGPPPDGPHWHRIHSLGSVEIGDDVEIGANATIDRGTIRATRIGSGSKIDNLVMLAHNVVIGCNCLIVSQTGIAGSTRVGDRVVLGGQCGVSDNIFIGDDVIAGGATKIYTNVPAGRVILGPSGLKMETELAARRNIRRLPRLFEQVAQLRDAIAGLSARG